MSRAPIGDGDAAGGTIVGLVVLDRDRFAIPPGQMATAHVLLTLLDGHPVYSDASLR